MTYNFDKLFNHSHMENKMTSLPNLAPALIKALAETQDIVADSTNPFHHNKYASLSAHLKALKPIFAKHGLAIMQFPTSGYDGGVGVKTIVIHTSGEMLDSSIVIDAPMSKGKDKNGNDFEQRGFTGQQAGAVISYLRRYALASVAGVATEDDDAEVDRVANGGEPAKSVSKTNYIPNASYQAAPASQSAYTPSSSEIDPSIAVPFGRSKGQAIGTLSKEDLKFWAESWEPRPYKETGRVTKKDATLKATAVALYNGTAASKASTPVDDVPFGDEDNPF